MNRQEPGKKSAAAPATSDLAGLQDILGHRFENPQILIQALTHSSAAKNRLDANERLEFLGDRVLGLALAGLVLEAFPGEKEGEIAYRFSALARSESLARVAEEIGLAPHIELSPGEEEAGGRQNASILADCCEAVIAALFLDGGLKAAETFIHRHWRPLMDEEPAPPKDAKTMLQEWAQAHGLPLPQYRVTGEQGPAHAPRFSVEVTVHEKKPASGQGPSKRAAEQIAAEALLARINPGK